MTDPAFQPNGAIEETVRGWGDDATESRLEELWPHVLEELAKLLDPQHMGYDNGTGNVLIDIDELRDLLCGTEEE